MRVSVLVYASESTFDFIQLDFELLLKEYKNATKKSQKWKVERLCSHSLSLSHTHILPAQSSFRLLLHFVFFYSSTFWYPFDSIKIIESSLYVMQPSFLSVCCSLCVCVG